MKEEIKYFTAKAILDEELEDENPRARRIRDGGESYASEVRELISSGDSLFDSLKNPKANPENVRYVPDLISSMHGIVDLGNKGSVFNYGERVERVSSNRRIVGTLGSSFTLLGGLLGYSLGGEVLMGAAALLSGGGISYSLLLGFRRSAKENYDHILGKAQECDDFLKTFNPVV